MLLRVLLFWVAFTVCSSAGVRAQGPEREGSSALVVPVEGTISFRTVALVRRALREARSGGKARVVLDIDTPGGEITSMQEVVALLSQLRETTDIETIAYVRESALSAGAVISLACSRIFMTRGARIGAAVPVYAGGMKDVLEDEVRNKLLAAFRVEIQTIAEEAHPNKPDIGLLAQAMVDQSLRLVQVDWKGADGVNNLRVLMTVDRLETLKLETGVQITSTNPLTTRPLVLTGEQAEEFQLSESVVRSLDDLMRDLGVAKKDIERFEATWSEELASFLHGIRMFLLIGGFLMAVVAFKTPGTGVPEALALLCFALFFAGSWLVGLAAVTEMLLFAGGIALILVELFVIPGTIISGFIGFLMVVAGLFLSLQPFVLPTSAMEGDVMESNLWSLLLSVLLVVVLALVLSRFLPKLPFFNKLILESSSPGTSLETTATTEQRHSDLVGKQGAALTDLRPAGRMDIDGEPYDVVAQAAFIVKGSPVEVVKVEGNRIVVEPVGVAEAGQIDVIWLVFMLFIGLLFVIAEVFFPTGGILGVAAAVLSIGSVFLAFQHGPGVGISFLAAVGVLVPTTVVFAFWWLDKSRWGKRIILSGPTFDPSEHKVREAGLDALVGKRGQALTTLRPSGTVEVDGRRVDAMTRGEQIEAGDEIEVVRIEMAQLVVKRVRTTDARNQTNGPGPDSGRVDAVPPSGPATSP